MSYALLPDLNIDPIRLAELTDSANAQGVVDMTLVTKALSDGAAYIDGVLFGKYQTPIPGTPPPLVVQWNAFISRYYLYSRRDTMVIPDGIARDYQSATKGIQLVADGKIDLPAPRVNAATPPTASGGSGESVRRHFGRKRDGL